MRTKDFNVTKIFSLAMLITFLLIEVSYASIKPISCETNFGEKSFTIEGTTVAFHGNKTQGRSISSVLTSTTRKSANGFRKTIYKNGNKHLINIENQNNFNSDNDFLAVTSPLGHKMTFPINCSQLD
ncbi:MAG: hypothetical protein HON90_08620 [Halobacteriovoraceae bacterium]|nr:hypothetical protein [Halobacteriovoraceae bacterium]